MKLIGKILGGISLLAIMITLGSVLLALPVMLLWNWLMPEIFGLVRIGFFQALGLLLLFGFLFGRNNSSSK